MFASIRRFGLLAGMMVLLLAVLAACGGAAADPVARVESFMKDMNSAFSDTGLTDTATQEKWADTLSKHYAPDEQAGQKAKMLESFKMIPPGALKIEGAKFEKVSEAGDRAEVKAVEGKMIMDFMGQHQEEPLTIDGNANIKLVKINGTWYLTEN